MAGARFRAVLLDLDGTLVDASDAIVDGVQELAAEAGLAVPERAWAKSFIGQHPSAVWQALGATDPETLMLRFRERWLPLLPARTRVLDGVPEALARLRRDGRLLAVATTRLTDSAEQTLRALDLHHAIELVVGRDQVAAAKPAPDALLLALTRLGRAPAEALMVGDTELDVRAAHAAGLPCWAVLGGIGTEQVLRDAGADLILSAGLADLPRALMHQES